MKKWRGKRGKSCEAKTTGGKKKKRKTKEKQKRKEQMGHNNEMNRIPTALHGMTLESRMACCCWVTGRVEPCGKLALWKASVWIEAVDEYDAVYLLMIFLSA